MMAVPGTVQTVSFPSATSEHGARGTVPFLSGPFLSGVTENRLRFIEQNPPSSDFAETRSQTGLTFGMPITDGSNKTALLSGHDDPS